MYQEMYRYSSQKYNSSLLAIGVIRVGTLHDFRCMEHKKGIADPQEGEKNVSHHIDQLHIPDSEDQNKRNTIDVKALEAFRAVKMSNSKDITFRNCTFQLSFDEPDCFILCTSKICSKETMSQFEGADSCVEIVEIEKFYRILTETLDSITPVPGTPSARRERGELSFAPAPVLQAAEGGLSNNRWSRKITSSDKRYALSLLKFFCSARPVIFRGIHEVIYQNRQEDWNGQNWGRHPAMIKETEFKKQSELRAIWQPRVNRPILPVILGNYRLGAFCRNVSIKVGS